MTGGAPGSDAPPVTHRSRLLREAPRPERVARHPNAHWLVVATVCIGAFMGQLDASIVTLALPAIRREFGQSVGAVEWVALAYLLVLVALVAPVGRLADSVGRKLLYLYGFVVFTVGSLLCGLAPSLPLLDGFRVLQAVGAALLQANSVALIAIAVPKSKLGRAIGIQGAAQAIGLALGPSVGGLLLGLGSWRLLFLVNVPAGIIGIVTGWLLLPRSRHLRPAQRMDWAGLGMFVPAVALLMLALSLAEHTRSLPLTVALLLVSAALGALFVWWERRVPAPIMDLHLFRSTAFSAGLGSGLLSYAVLFGVLFVTPFYLEGALRDSPQAAGLELTLLPVMIGLAAPLAGTAADRFGARTVTMSGMLIVAVALVGIAAAHQVPVALAVALAVVGLGLGLFTPANNAAIMRSAPPNVAGSASGVLNMTRGLGTALGVALGGLVFALAQGPPGVGAIAGRDSRGMTAVAITLVALSLASAVLAGLRGRVGAGGAGHPAPGVVDGGL